MYVCMYTFIWQCTYVAVFLSALFSRSCCSHFYCITSLNLNRAEPSFGSHGCSPGSLWHLAALRGWVSATCKHSQTKYTHTHAQTGTHIQTTHRRTRHTCSWPFPRSCSELFARLSLSLSFSLRLVEVRLNDDDDDGSEVDDSSSDCDGRLCLYQFLPCLALKARQASREQRSNPSGRRQKSSKQQQKSV